MPASPEIREAIRQGSWIRKMFEDGAVLKAERGEENVFDFTLGNPYGDPPAALSAELARLCADPPPGLHRYMPNAGVPEARRAAALSLSRSTGLPFTEDLLVMTVGAAGALNVALHAILSPGDEVVILAPYFVEYLFYIRNAFGTPVVAETDARFQLDLAAIEAALTPKTRAILINTPNNPTGAVYPGEDLAALDRALSAAEKRFGNPIYVISDEPYRKIVFRGVSSTPAAAKIRNTLVAYSHSKDLNLPGERIGYLAVSPRAADAAEVAGACVFCNRVLGFVNAPSLFQIAVSKFEDEPADVSVYQENRDVLLDALRRAGIRRRPARGGVLPVPEIPRPRRDGVRRRGARRGDPRRPGVRVRAKRPCPRRLLPLPGNGEPLGRRVGAARTPLSRRGDPAMTVVFRRNVSRMEGYVPGEQPRERGFIKLNTNENPYPPSPKVRKAILRELGESLRLYPDPGSAALRRQAALTYGFDLPGVIAGNGSDDLLAMIARAFVGEGDLLACPVPTYTLYDTLVRIQGGILAGVPYPDDYSLPRGLAGKKARVTIVANPNSPSGTAVPVRALAELADAVPGLLVVDEAYADFADETALALARERRNVIVLRTLSKSFSLAGMRIGLGFAHPRIIEGLDKVRDSYNLNRLSIAAGVAALADTGWMERNAARIRKTREALAAALPGVGFTPFPSQSNFILARRTRGRSARPVYEALKRRKILVRYFDTPRLAGCLRITVGTDDEVAALLDAMKAIR